MSPDISYAELKQQYNELSKLYHPDKPKMESTHAPPPLTKDQLDHLPPDKKRDYYDQKRQYDFTLKEKARWGDAVYDYTTRSQELNDAWSHFRTPTDRALYNYISGYAGPTAYWYVEYHTLKAREYQEHCRAVEGEYFKKLRAWADGYRPPRPGQPAKKPAHFPQFFVLEALYGDVVPASSPTHPTPAGRCIDVTFVLRKMAEQHFASTDQPGLDLDNKFAERMGLSCSFSLQQHFYDPNFEQQNVYYNTVLYVRYLHQDKLYEAYIPDNTPQISLPHADHLVAQEDRWNCFDRDDDNTYPPEWVAEVEEAREEYKMDIVPIMSPKLSALVHHFATPLQTKPAGFSSTQMLLGHDMLAPPKEGNDNNNNNNSLSTSQTSSNTANSSNSSGSATPYDDEFLQPAPISPVRDQFSLQVLPPHLLHEDLYHYSNGPALPRQVWDVKMRPIKAKRRRTLYIALTGLITTILSFLHWRGMIDMVSWPGTAHTVGLQLIEFIQEAALGKTSRKEEQNDV